MKEHEITILKKTKAYAEQAIEFKGELTFEEFSKDSKTVAACALNLSQIGELAGRLDESFIEAYDEIPWKKIRGMRNRIVHDYEGLRLSIVWDVLDEFLPQLILDIRKTLASEVKGEE